MNIIIINLLWDPNDSKNVSNFIWFSWNRALNYVFSLNRAQFVNCISINIETLTPPAQFP